MTIQIFCNCGTESPKYKCPICRTPYCSVNCCRDHKSKGCVPPPPADCPEILENVKSYFPTEDTLRLVQLQKLRDSSKVKECLDNPHLRHIMEVIDKSKNPTDLIAQAMLEPIFVEFATECLKVIEPEESTFNSSDEE